MGSRRKNDSGDERPSPIGSPLSISLNVIRVVSENKKLRIDDFRFARA
jgi:hypothetical protein